MKRSICSCSDPVTCRTERGYSFTYLRDRRHARAAELLGVEVWVA